MMAKRVEFTPPSGVVPEGTMPGEEFDAVTTYRVKDGGTICAVMIGDVKMPGYESGGGSMHKPEYQPPDEMEGY